MPTSISECSALLADGGIRHHVDAEQEVIRVAFVSRRYRNLRGEKLIVIAIESRDGGRRCRASIQRVFPVATDAASLCIELCRLAADVPFVAVEFAAASDNLCLVADIPIEDGSLTSQQLMAMLARLVDAAEEWTVALDSRLRRCAVRRAA